jgi:hypothetical protein
MKRRTGILATLAWGSAAVGLAGTVAAVVWASGPDPGSLQAPACRTLGMSCAHLRVGPIAASAPPVRTTTPGAKPHTTAAPPASVAATVVSTSSSAPHQGTTAAPPAAPPTKHVAPTPHDTSVQPVTSPDLPPVNIVASPFRHATNGQGSPSLGAPAAGLARGHKGHGQGHGSPARGRPEATGDAAVTPLTTAARAIPVHGVATHQSGAHSD